MGVRTTRVLEIDEVMKVSRQLCLVDPCMSSRRVGQGRVYVQLGKIEQIDFAKWCEGLCKGRSYVGDGYAHAVEFTVNGQSSGYDDIRLTGPGEVTVKAKVAFATEIPKAVAYGQLMPAAGRRMVGDTINLHAPRSGDTLKGGNRLVEIVAGGHVVAGQQVPADGKIHELQFTVKVDRSNWIALRQFPQLHTNPVNVIIANRPIRVSRQSALWCAETIKLLWKNRHTRIAEHERDNARATYQKAIATYQRLAKESPMGIPR